MAVAVFPGSFDPPTYGHLNIIERASKIFEKVDVLISINPDKNYLFSEDERMKMITELTKNYSNVTVHVWEGLVVNYCKKTNANVLIRGIRNSSDFAHEFDLSLFNHYLDNNIETLFLPTEQKYFLIRSSNIKELARFNGDVSEMVPEIVDKALKEKYQQKLQK